MKKAFIDIRDRATENHAIEKTYVFKGDISVIVTNPNRIMIIEHEIEGGKTTYIDLTETQVFSVRNWG